MDSLSQAQVTVTVTGTFRNPAFEFVQGSHQLQRCLFSSLKDFDLRLENVQESGAFSSPANWSTTFSFLSFKARLVVRADNYELTLSPVSMAEKDLAAVKAILTSAEAGIAAAGPHLDLAMANRFFACFTHFQHPPGGYEAIVRPFLGVVPEGLGEIRGQGVSFYFQDSLFSHEATVHVEKSLLYAGGLFIQIRCSFDAQTFTLDQGVENFATYVGKVLRLFGLQQ